MREESAVWERRGSAVHTYHDPVLTINGFMLCST